MKSISVLLVALILVVAVAASGSRAQPLTQATSDAHRNCIAGKCQPVERIVVAQTEFEANLDALSAADARDTPAASAADPDPGPFAAIAVRVALEAARAAGLAALVAAAAEVGRRAGDWVADRLFGSEGRGGGATLAQANLNLSSIFDPVPVR